MTGLKTIYNRNFFVITGGPGVGKTTLLRELEKRNFKYIPEVAREIIKEQVSSNGKALPWKNTELYKELMMERSIASYKLANQTNNEILFFDRGIPDTLSYARLINSSISTQMDFYTNHYRYNEKVFILPPWLEIYTTDNERKQTWKEAVQTYETLAATYKQYNYELIEVPKTPVKERVEFILTTLNLNKTM
jgi:predicted ATPase